MIFVRFLTALSEMLNWIKLTTIMRLPNGSETNFFMMEVNRPGTEFAQAMAAQSSEAAVSTPPPDKKYPFPTTDRVIAGTPEATILTAFGRPAVKVTGAETGELRERYVYVDRGTGRKTYIGLVNAVVTSVQTLNP